jgi:hypothetical protein
MRTHIRLLTLAASVAALLPVGISNAFAQYQSYSPPQEKRFYLTLSGGADRQIGDDDFERYEWGFNIAGNALGQVNKYFLLGGRVAYNRWTADEAEFLDEENGLDDIDIEGEVWSMEILPIARLATSSELPAGIFAQGGAGLYVLDNNLDITATNETGEERTLTFGNEASPHFGVQGGVGASIDLFALRIELYPLYNYVWTDENSDIQYITYNVGVGLGF